MGSTIKMFESNDLSDIRKLLNDIKQKKNVKHYDVALKTEELLEKLITEKQWKSARELMNIVRAKISYIGENLPEEVTSSNVMRHFLKIIRELYESGSKKKGLDQSLHQLVTGSLNEVLDYSEHLSNLKSSLLDHLGEYKVELETSTDNIAAQACEHIHTNEIILTVGKSTTVEKFLTSAAAKKRVYSVIVVEEAPYYYGHTLARTLGKHDIQTTVITDSGVFAIMSRVNKVIIGTNTLLADGGLRAASGIHSVALAAKHYSVPVMVLSHMHKFTPLYIGSQNHEAINVCASPANVVPYAMGSILNKIDIYDPVFDYIPPELITLFISHQGGNAPSYVYRLLSELYHPDDYDI